VGGYVIEAIRPPGREDIVTGFSADRAPRRRHEDQGVGPRQPAQVRNYVVVQGGSCEHRQGPGCRGSCLRARSAGLSSGLGRPR